MESSRRHLDAVEFVASWLARSLFEGRYHIGEMGRKWTPMVVGHEHYRFPLPMTGRRYRLAFYCSDNREARPHISVAINQTVVDRLFAVK